MRQWGDWTCSAQVPCYTPAFAEPIPLPGDSPSMATVRVLLLILALVCCSGCLRGTKTDIDSPPPASKPTTTEKVRTSIANLGLNANPGPDSHAVRLVVKPMESFGAPGSRCLVIATVTDAEGQPRRQKKIEWSLDGVGEIAAVDTASYLSVLERKPQNKFGVSFTGALARTIKGEAGEDVYLQPGQSWCMLSSEVEGDCKLTVHCPEITTPAAREVFVTRRWADVSWVVPQTVVARLGEQPVIATQVIRASDRQPTQGYRVRYRLIDGPPALFSLNRAQHAEVSTANGFARAALFEPNPRPGRNRVAVELLKSNPGSPEAEPVVLAHSQTVVDWQAPQASLVVRAPSAAVVGQEFPVALTVANSGQFAATNLIIRMPSPEGALFIRSEPPARDDGGQLMWSLPRVGPGESVPITATFKTPSSAVVQFAASLQGNDGIFVQQRAITRTAVAQLIVDVQAPPTAAPGDNVTYEITVTNGGSGTATNVALSAAYDEGLEHASHAHPIEFRIGNLEPGKSKTVSMPLTPRQLGSFRVRFTASGDGNLRGEALHTIAISGKTLSVHVTGPATRYVDRTGEWEVRVGNPGSVPMTNVLVRVQLPAELECRSVTDKGQFSSKQAVWRVGNLGPAEQRTYKLTAAALTLVDKTEITAGATADGVNEQRSIAPVEVLGAPAVRVEITSPVAVTPLKSKVTYRIVVRNVGSLAARRVATTVEFTPNVLKGLAATGPTIGRLSGSAVTFDPLDRLESKQDAVYLVEVEANNLGDGRIKVSVKPEHGQQPTTTEEAVTVVPAPPEKVQGNGVR